jgi:hypothetical protein
MDHGRLAVQSHEAGWNATAEASSYVVVRDNSLHDALHE